MPPDIDAVLDPWCAVDLIDGGCVLFGFALRHSGTGGLSWTCSTRVRTMDPARRRAVTASGRRYELRREIELRDIPDAGLEAWLAFELLVGDDAKHGAAVPPVSADPEREARWLAACKIARHLGLPTPGCAPSVVEAFLARNFDAYCKLRAANGPLQ
jgi:hypothetical protein